MLELLDGYGEPLDPRFSKVTIRQLLLHAGGWDRGQSYDAMFRAVEIADALDVRPPATAEQVIRYMVTRQKLDFDPGERYAYSNFGYCLLGRVIEKLTRQSYEKHVRQCVLCPIGVRCMQIGKTRLSGRAANEVRYHDELQRQGPSVFPPVGEQVPLPYGAWHLEAMDSHGAWIATASDVARFGARLHWLLTPCRDRVLVSAPRAAAVGRARSSGRLLLWPRLARASGRGRTQHLGTRARCPAPARCWCAATTGFAGPFYSIHATTPTACG